MANLRRDHHRRRPQRSRNRGLSRQGRKKSFGPRTSLDRRRYRRTEEVFPGFKYFACAHLAGSFSSEFIADLDLRSHGFELIELRSLFFAPSLDGHSLLIPRDSDKAASGNRTPFQVRRRQISGVLCPRQKSLGVSPNPLWHAATRQGQSGQLQSRRVCEDRLEVSPPRRKRDVRVSAHPADERRRFAERMVRQRSCSKRRWRRAACSLLSSVRANRERLSTSSIISLAHRTARYARQALSAAASAISHKLLARPPSSFGAEIRTASEVLKIVTKDGAATGVVLKNGEEIQAAQVISNADVKRTFLQLVEPTYLDPHFLLQVRNIRSRGTVAKINLALDALPNFASANGHGAAALSGIIHIGPTLDYLERAADDAKYGRFSQQPFLEITIPSIADPSLAPPENMSCRSGCNRRRTICAKAIGTSGATAWATRS